MKVKTPTFEKPASMKAWAKTPQAMKHPSLTPPPERFADESDDTLQALTRELGGDEKLAKRVMKLKKQFPLGTFPELVTYDWLQRRGIFFEYQKAVLGGRALRGGQVVDFALDQGLFASVWEVQGRYWHTRPGKIQADEAERMALMSIEIFGKPVKYVVEIWDTRIMDKHKRNQVFEQALAGVELGQ